MNIDFKVGDVLMLVEEGNQIGNVVFCTPNDKSSKNSMERMRNIRFEFIKIANRKTFDGEPCLRLRRLDTKGHGVETWPAALVRKEKTDNQNLDEYIKNQIYCQTKCPRGTYFDCHSGGSYRDDFKCPLEKENSQEVSHG